MSEKCNKHPYITLYNPECDVCAGEGWRDSDDWQDFGDLISCYRCHGTGRCPWKTCEICDQEYMDQQADDDANNAYTQEHQS